MPRGVFVSLFLLSLIWGASFFLIKLLLAHFQPWTVVFLRSVFGFATLLVVCLLRREKISFKQTPWLALVCIGLFNTAIPWGLISWSELRLSSSMASVLNATTPLWTLVIGLVVFRIKSSRMQWLGILIGFVGLLILLDINPISIISADGWGFSGMMAATFCYGVAAHLSKKYVSGFSVFFSSLATLATCVVFSGVTAFSVETVNLTWIADWPTIFALVALGAFGSGVAYLLYYYIIQEGTPELVSMVTYLVPVTAILWGYLLLDETIHWTLLLGLVCILLGVFTANRRSQPDKKVEETAS